MQLSMRNWQPSSAPALHSTAIGDGDATLLEAISSPTDDLEALLLVMENMSLGESGPVALDVLG
jgi:hypothetical protein